MEYNNLLVISGHSQHDISHLNSIGITLIVFFSLARVNSLYRVRDGVITQIVKGDPQWPQSFYPLSSPIEIQSDDYIVGQCVYDNDNDHVVRVG